MRQSNIPGQQSTPNNPTNHDRSNHLQALFNSERKPEIKPRTGGAQ